MKDHVQALMADYQAPMTRDEYVKWSNLGKSTKVTPEEEAELPQRFQYPTVTHESMPEPDFGEKKSKGPAKQDKPGAVDKPPKAQVHHFNGKSYKTADDKPIKNHDIYIKGPEPDSPDVRDEYGAAPTPTSGGIKFDRQNYYKGDTGMMNRNGEKVNVEQKPDEQREF